MQAIRSYTTGDDMTIFSLACTASTARSVTVLEYGDNVSAVLKRVERLTSSELAVLATAGGDSKFDLGLDAAWYRARSAARRARLDATWAHTRIEVWTATWRRAEACGVSHREEAADAVALAACAYLVLDLIEPSDFRELARPWLAAVGPR